MVGQGCGSNEDGVAALWRSQGRCPTYLPPRPRLTLPHTQAHVPLRRRWATDNTNKLRARPRRCPTHRHHRRAVQRLRGLQPHKGRPCVLGRHATGSMRCCRDRLRVTTCCRESAAALPPGPTCARQRTSGDHPPLCCHSKAVEAWIERSTQSVLQLGTAGTRAPGSSLCKGSSAALLSGHPWNGAAPTPNAHCMRTCWAPAVAPAHKAPLRGQHLQLHKPAASSPACKREERGSVPHTIDPPLLHFSCFIQSSSAERTCLRTAERRVHQPSNRRPPCPTTPIGGRAVPCRLAALVADCRAWPFATAARLAWLSSVESPAPDEAAMHGRNHEATA